MRAGEHYISPKEDLIRKKEDYIRTIGEYMRTLEDVMFYRILRGFSKSLHFITIVLYICIVLSGIIITYSKI